MKTKEYFDGTVAHFEYTTQKEMGLAFARVMEFCERPKELVVGKVMGWQEWLEAHMDDNGTVDYFNNWLVYNLTTVEYFSWVELLSHRGQNLHMSTPERDVLRDMFLEMRQAKYVIATLVDDEETLHHELAHVLYATNESYRLYVTEAMHFYFRGVTLRGDVLKELIAAGYDGAIPHLIDEWQAYMVGGWDDVFSESLQQRLGLLHDGFGIMRNPIKTIFFNFLGGME